MSSYHNFVVLDQVNPKEDPLVQRLATAFTSSIDPYSTKQYKFTMYETQVELSD